MNDEIKKEWVAALRSGEFEQVRSSLRSRNDRYCCLGVLCEVAHRHGVGQWRNDISSESDIWFYGPKGLPPSARRPGGEFQHSRLSSQVLDWSGLVGTLGEVSSHADDILSMVEERHPDLYVKAWWPSSLALADLNDAGVPFATIADIIERYL